VGRVGVPYSPRPVPIESHIVSQMSTACSLPEGTKPICCACGAGRKGEYARSREYLKRAFSGSRSTARSTSWRRRQSRQEIPPQDIDVVVTDRVPRHGQRLAESFETALKLAEGLAVIEYADAPPLLFYLPPCGGGRPAEGRSGGG